MFAKNKILTTTVKINKQYRHALYYYKIWKSSQNKIFMNYIVFAVCEFLLEYLKHHQKIDVRLVSNLQEF